MNTKTIRFAAVAALMTTSAVPVLAQVQQPMPQAQPVATQASVINLDNRIVALERQIADLLRAEEENGRRISELEATLKSEREASASRIAALESRLTAGLPSVASTEPAAEKPKPAPVSSSPGPKPSQTATSSEDATDPAEEAYDAGYQLWKAGKYDEAIGALRAFSSAYPNHRRTSWANNLAGRAMLDKGEPRAAAEALLANYRKNPKGERAADSLYYLGQSLMKLNQPSQACKAYAELEAVYGDGVRADLKKLLPPAKAEAKCS
ncbi:tetratricopeptide repeat protein [Sphingomonas daechungensis]|uniref:tetratricopeptide repeat protein n=1 Tax=Sphingomonas daechungensis TaxID=1176646 RepID=UPI0037835F3C